MPSTQDAGEVRAQTLETLLTRAGRTENGPEVCLNPFLVRKPVMCQHGFSRWLSSKEPSCQCRRCRFKSWAGKIPGGENDNPLQYSCLENSMDRGVWRAHGVAKSQTQLSD